ncbi:hypothetical protein SAMN06265376_11432 [Dokdonia pacifica]|uniref:Uncharacterized protein n=2 Tax=Dokdonia pacifica TaxID=1627892 RepID=A0A239E8N8_9FLAO|nr:hypothetical protein SAMN06265376_11432 [Dokdonia pacifica]
MNQNTPITQEELDAFVENHNNDPTSKCKIGPIKTITISRNPNHDTTTTAKQKQLLNRLLQEAIHPNQVFFDAFEDDYRKAENTISKVFSNQVPAFKIALWADLGDRELRTLLKDLGGYIVALKKKVPYKVLNVIIKHLEYNKQFLRLVEDCFYFYQYQDHYTTAGKDVIEQFNTLYKSYLEGVLTDTEKDTFFKLCSKIRKETATNHLKRYAELLLGVSYDELNQIMSDCYMGCLVIETDPLLDIFL